MRKASISRALWRLIAKRLEIEYYFKQLLSHISYRSLGLQVVVRVRLCWIGPLVGIVLEAELDELHGLLGDLAALGAAGGKLDLFGGEDEFLVEDLLLRDPVAERLAAVEQLVEDDSC